MQRRQGCHCAQCRAIRDARRTMGWADLRVAQAKADECRGTRYEAETRREVERLKAIYAAITS